MPSSSEPPGAVATDPITQRATLLLSDDFPCRQALPDFLERTVAALPLIVCVLCGPEWRFVMANAATQHLATPPDVPLLGRTLNEAFPIHGQIGTSSLLEEAAVTGLTVCRREQHLSLPQHGDTWWDVDYVPLPEVHGKTDCVLVVGRDVSDHVRARQRIEQAVEELESFSYSVSHDLRAPLRAIDGFSALLTESNLERLDEVGLRYLEQIRREAVRMGRLIDDLLAFSRMGRQEMVRASVRLEPIIRDLWDSLLEGAGGRLLELHLGPMPEVRGDPAMLRHVFVNLLDNAIKFTGPREVGVVEVGHRREPGEDVFWVRDNGVGFDMRYVDKLFGVFQRLHGDEDFKGTGVGLALVRRIMHRHRGRAWAEGEVERGATFYVALPR